MLLKPTLPVTPPLRGWGATDKHRRRVRLLLLYCSYILILAGGGWGIYLALCAKWSLVVLDFSLAAVGGFALAFSLSDRLRAAALLAGPTLLVFLSVLCLFDVPVAGGSRSLHLHLLSLAAGSHLLFRAEKPHLRFGLPMLSLTAFLIFGAGDFGVMSPELLPPPEVRVVGAWINYLIFIVTISAILVIMQADVTVRNEIEDDLRRAIAEGHFMVYYQAQTSDEGGQVVGAEALLRWQHPQRGMIPPNRFIPIAEETGLIVPIGDWVLKTACAQLVSWATDPRTAGLTLAVNVSASQFRQPDFVAHVLSIVELSGIQSSRLKLELTESMLVKDIDDVIQKMMALKARGIGLSLDDFGTGFSSLSYLKRLPLDQLKIDQDFVRDLLTDSKNQTIARALISLGGDLGLSVIAEGVETESQHAWLRDNGCHLFQGFLFSKPVPVDEFEALVNRSSAMSQCDPAVSIEPRHSIDTV